jgi:hypothetical protein
VSSSAASSQVEAGRVDGRLIPVVVVRSTRMELSHAFQR